ncbi:hypothetical protein [Mycolicibacterium agri]|uniref:hypothetical protein n=1 Tax=Mycolicibacterium agri TaxID=36811 RepID=UPI001F4299F2|nr:hypothetical protein [Mycolicibacterium agri]
MPIGCLLHHAGPGIAPPITMAETVRAIIESLARRLPQTVAAARCSRECLRGRYISSVAARGTDYCAKWSPTGSAPTWSRDRWKQPRSVTP